MNFCAIDVQLSKIYETLFKFVSFLSSTNVLYNQWIAIIDYNFSTNSLQNYQYLLNSD